MFYKGGMREGWSNMHIKYAITPKLSHLPEERKSTQIDIGDLATRLGHCPCIDMVTNNRGHGHPFLGVEGYSRRAAERPCDVGQE